jgi:AraC family transcriptional regulator
LHREFSRKDEVSILAIEGLILEILAEVSRKPNYEKTSPDKSPRWIKEVDDYLRSNFTESFTLEEIAKIAGVHSVHLARVFREKYGCTIGEYIRKLRIDFACRQIKKDMPMSEIALSAGFADQSHFTRIFKSQIGITPTEYKKNLKNVS